MPDKHGHPTSEELLSTGARLLPHSVKQARGVIDQFEADAAKGRFNPKPAIEHKAPQGKYRLIGIDAGTRGNYLILDGDSADDAVLLASKHNQACRWGDDHYKVFDDQGRDITQP